MSQITISATFNKQTKDSKKELVQFYVKGQDEHKPELNLMCREAVELQVEGVDQTLTAKFDKKTQDANKTTLDFILMGNPSTNNSFEFYRKAGQTVNLTITESQMSIEELEEAHKGIKYNANPDGTVDVDSDQMDMDEVAAAIEETIVQGEPQDDIAKAKAKRKTKAETEAEAAAPEEKQDGADDDLLDEDGLPF